jgi:hypothetical protein
MIGIDTFGKSITKKKEIEPKTVINQSNKPMTHTQTTNSQRSLYRFSDYPEGIIRIYVEGNFHFYPKGGQIKICPPSGRCWMDTPGVDQYYPKEKAGWFIITPADASATGVEIHIESR